MSFENSNLTAEQICVVIKACGECGVAKFKCGSLEVEFLQKLEPAPAPIVQAAPPSLPDTEISEAQTSEDDLKRIEREEKELRRQQLRELIFTDPVAYEELCALGELEDERSPSA